MTKSKNIAKKIIIRIQKDIITPQIQEKDIITPQIQEAEATTILDQQQDYLPHVVQAQEQVQGLEGVDNFLKFNK
tara:strand:- start:1677 stop:1901 length:225 start_codon:yes stop_codon:yes gene_type:complete